MRKRKRRNFRQRIFARKSEGKTQAQKIGRLILLPSCDAEALRGYLRKNGWACVREELIEDAGRIYALIVVEQGQERSPGGIYDKFGYFPVLCGDPLAKKLGKRHLHAMKKALAQLEKEGGSRKRARQIKQSMAKTKILLMTYFE